MGWSFIQGGLNTAVLHNKHCSNCGFEDTEDVAMHAHVFKFALLSAVPDCMDLDLANSRTGQEFVCVPCPSGMDGDGHQCTGIRPKSQTDLIKLGGTKIEIIQRRIVGYLSLHIKVPVLYCQDSACTCKDSVSSLYLSC